MTKDELEALPEFSVILCPGIQLIWQCEEGWEGYYWHIAGTVNRQWSSEELSNEFPELEVIYHGKALS